MPSKTPKQQRAMAAAAHGNSTIGIPKSVGKEFMQADILRKRSKRHGGSNSGGGSIGGGTSGGAG